MERDDALKATCTFDNVIKLATIHLGFSIALFGSIFAALSFSTISNVAYWGMLAQSPFLLIYRAMQKERMKLLGRKIERKKFFIVAGQEKSKDEDVVLTTLNVIVVVTISLSLFFALLSVLLQFIHGTARPLFRT